MGTCCERNLITTMDNHTKIYFKPKANLKHKKIYRIKLQGDIYKICPTKNSLTETDEIFKRQGDLLTLLKDDKGIKTGEHTIRMQLENILIKDDHKKENCQNLIFQDPQVNEDNKTHLFKCLAGSIYNFDKYKKKHYLKNIYVPWDLGKQRLNQLINQQVNHLTILIPKS